MLPRPPALALLAPLLAACSAAWRLDDDTAGSADSAPADTADSGDPLCAGASALTWDNFGHGFLVEACDGCHAGTSPDRHEAPADATFDTVAQAWAWRDRILARSTGDAPSMPPQGGVTEDDRTRLYWWLACGVPGT